MANRYNNLKPNKMETKIDFQKVVEMVKAKRSLRSIFKEINVTETFFYRNISNEQLDKLKEIRNRYVYKLNSKLIYERFLAGESPAELAQEYKVSKATINLAIDRGLDIYREDLKKVSEIEHYQSINPMKQYMNELINFMLSPEGLSLPQDKLIRIIIEVKDLNNDLQLQ